MMRVVIRSVKSSVNSSVMRSVNSSVVGSVLQVVAVAGGQPLTAPTVMPLTKYFWTKG